MDRSFLAARCLRFALSQISHSFFHQIGKSEEPSLPLQKDGHLPGPGECRQAEKIRGVSPPAGILSFFPQKSISTNCAGMHSNGFSGAHCSSQARRCLGVPKAFGTRMSGNAAFTQPVFFLSVDSGLARIDVPLPAAL